MVKIMCQWQERRKDAFEPTGRSVVEPVETTIGLFLTAGVSTGSTPAFHPQDSSVVELVETTAL